MTYVALTLISFLHLTFYQLIIAFSCNADTCNCVLVVPEEFVSSERLAAMKDRIVSRQRRESNTMAQGQQGQQGPGKQFYVVDYFVIVDFAIYNR